MVFFLPERGHREDSGWKAAWDVPGSDSCSKQGKQARLPGALSTGTEATRPAGEMIQSSRDWNYILYYIYSYYNFSASLYLCVTAMLIYFHLN